MKCFEYLRIIKKITEFLDIPAYLNQLTDDSFKRKSIESPTCDTIK